MSVYLEFTIDGDAFQFGQVLSPPPAMHVELERLVPTGEMVMPFLWVTGDDFEAFEEKVQGHSSVLDFRAYDRIGDRALYRIEWNDAPTDLLTVIADTQAVVLEARGNGTWMFRLRFPDHEQLTHFHNAIIEEDLQIHIEQTYTLTDSSQPVQRFGLTQDQREALVIALKGGYFATPKTVSLDELAADLDITPQALSNRIRLGTEKVLRTCLLSSVSDLE